MESKIVLGWKPVEGGNIIAIGVMPKEGDEWMEFTSGIVFTSLDELKRTLEQLALAMFPDAVEKATIQ